jgi:dTDP-L-rhamnose 4-epimerase
MKAIITGGAGFIGSRLAKRLVAAGHLVTLVDTLSPQIHGDVPDVALPEGATLIRASVNDLEPAHVALEQADVIVHLAAETGTGQSMYRVCHYVQVNELGTAHLLETLGRLPRRPRKIVLASSRSVYGEGAFERVDGKGNVLQPPPRDIATLQAGKWEFTDTDGTRLNPVATPETLGFAPASIYAATKAAQELLLLAGCESIGARAVILRLQNVYGEGQSLRNPYTGIISIFFNQARQGLAINLYEDGLATRDFVHVDDVVTAFTAAIDADLPHGLVMNVGSGKPTSIMELARALVGIADFAVPQTVSGKFRLGDIRHNWADLDRATRYIGYRPAVSLEQGLKRFVAWAKSQPTYADRSREAERELVEKGLSA